MNTQTYSQLQCIKQGGPFEVVQAVKPAKLEPDQVLVRQTVIALNGLDWKQRDFGILVETWPHVLGIEGAGVVDSVGSKVQRLQPGDEVMCWASGMAHGATWGGAYQEYIVMPACYVAKRPGNISMTEAASLPICYNTAVCAINGSLNIPLPFIEGTSGNGHVPGSILILGGGSNVGAGTLNLLRVAYPTLSIFVTSSPKHSQRLEALGASRVFDYHLATVVSEVKNASPGGRGVEVVIDCVGAVADMDDIADVFEPEADKKLVAVLTGSPKPDIENVTVSMVNGYMLVGLHGGPNVIPTLTELVESGRYKVAYPARVVGHGLQEIAGVMDMTKTARGEKLVVVL